MITNKVVDEAQAWHDKYNKPVLIAEYGADTFPGLHEVNSDLLKVKLHKKPKLRVFNHFISVARVHME